MPDEFFHGGSNQNSILLLLQNPLVVLGREDREEAWDGAGTSSQLVLPRLVQAKCTEPIRDRLNDLDYGLEPLLDDTVEHFW